MGLEALLSAIILGLLIPNARTWYVSYTKRRDARFEDSRQEVTTADVLGEVVDGQVRMIQEQGKTHFVVLDIFKILNAEVEANDRKKEMKAIIKEMKDGG